MPSPAMVLYKGLTAHLQVPKEGTFKDKRKKKVADVERTLDKIWRIGGTNGWYAGGWLWGIRGLMDKMVGGRGPAQGGGVAPPNCTLVKRLTFGGY